MSSVIACNEFYLIKSQSIRTISLFLSQKLDRLISFQLLKIYPNIIEGKFYMLKKCNKYEVPLNFQIKKVYKRSISHCYTFLKKFRKA